MATMRVLHVRWMEPPELIEIPHTLEAMHTLVGGYLQAIYPWEDPVALVCSDTAKLDGLPPNRMLEDYDIIAGNFFICGLGRENFASIPDELAEKYTEKFRYPELFFLDGDGDIRVVKAGSGEEPVTI